jgi:predicted DNA-binding transcriptional regulator YafY
MLQTSARLLRLLSLLQQRRHWSGQQLAERLEVDARTLRRDVDKLRELGYPVHASAGVGGGYQLGAGSSVPPVLLNDDEAVAIGFALRAAAGSVGKMEETSIGLLAKLDQVMPPRLRKRASALHSVTLSLANSQSAPPVDVLTGIASACRDHIKVKLNYKDRDGKGSSRTLEPLKLVHTGHRWYLVAWDTQRDDWRTFRVDRIERLVSTGPQFTPRKFPGDIAEYVSQAMRHVAYRYRVRLKLRGSLEVLSKKVPGWCGSLEPADEGCCFLSTGADSIESLAAMMLMTGADFEILDAPDLLPDLRVIAERLRRATR